MNYQLKEIRIGLSYIWDGEKCYYNKIYNYKDFKFYIYKIQTGKFTKMFICNNIDINKDTTLSDIKSLLISTQEKITFVELNNDNSIFQNICSWTGSRLGNNLFGLFRTFKYIYVDQQKEDILYIFLLNRPIFSFLSKYLSDIRYINIPLANINIKFIEDDSIPFILRNEDDPNIRIGGRVNWYANDILNSLLNISEYKKYFKEFINQLVKPISIKDEYYDYVKITLPYRLSDFCSNDADNKIKPSDDLDIPHCFNKHIKSEIGISGTPDSMYPILSFSYYKKCIEKILNKYKNSEGKKFLIIIYYFDTNYDKLIIELFQKYILNSFPESDIKLVTEYEYYTDMTYNELDLIYAAKDNDEIILSNSTLSYWIVFFNILQNYNGDIINNIYYGNKLNYYIDENISWKNFFGFEVNHLHNSAFLQIDQNITHSYKDDVLIYDYSKNELVVFNENNKIETPNYFPCMPYDILRLLLIIIYVQIFNIESKIKELPLICILFINYIKENISKIMYTHIEKDIELLCSNFTKTRAKLIKKFSDITEKEIKEAYEGDCDKIKDEVTRIYDSFKKVIYNIEHTNYTISNFHECIELLETSNIYYIKLLSSMSEDILSGWRAYYKFHKGDTLDHQFKLLTDTLPPTPNVGGSYYRKYLKYKNKYFLHK